MEVIPSGQSEDLRAAPPVMNESASSIEASALSILSLASADSALRESAASKPERKRPTPPDGVRQASRQGPRLGAAAPSLEISGKTEAPSRDATAATVSTATTTTTTTVPRSMGYAEAVEFLQTVYALCRNTKFTTAIGFGSAPEGFLVEIRSAQEFTDNVLPAYFKERTLEWFCEQLEALGFARLPSAVNYAVYSHLLFRPGRPDLLPSLPNTPNKVVAGVAGSASKMSWTAKARTTGAPRTPKPAGAKSATTIVGEGASEQAGSDGRDDMSHETEGSEDGNRTYDHSEDEEGDNADPDVVEKARARKFRSQFTFTQAAYSLATDPANEAIVGFNADGTMLEIRDVSLFCTLILPRYFRHKNLSSFVRQLNTYGFEKVDRFRYPLTAENTFRHANFLRDRPELLSQIRTERRTQNRKSRAAETAVPATGAPEVAVAAAASPGEGPEAEHEVNGVGNGLEVSDAILSAVAKRVTAENLGQAINQTLLEQVTKLQEENAALLEQTKAMQVLHEKTIVEVIDLRKIKKEYDAMQALAGMSSFG